MCCFENDVSCLTIEHNSLAVVFTACGKLLPHYDSSAPCGMVQIRNRC